MLRRTATNVVGCLVFIVFVTPSHAQLSFNRNTIDSNLSSAYWVYSTDIDGDGDPDLVSASFTGIHWWKNNGSGNFSKIFVGSLSGAWTAYADDIDEDGDVDILGGSPATDEVKYWRNNGSESFTEILADNVAQDPETVFAADLDGDGDKDILASAWIDGKVYAFENTGGGSFTSHVVDANLSGAHSVRAADLDGDGDPDIAACGSGATRWYRNNGNFSFSQLFLASNGGWSVFIADIDGDGDQDVLRSQRDNGDVDWLQNNGGSFSERNIESGYGECWSVAAGDLDGDGDLDVAAAGFEANNIKAWLNNGSGGFGSGLIVDSVNRPRGVFIADFDGDGDGDIAAAIRDDQDLTWYETGGSPPPSKTLTLNFPNGGETLLTSDLETISWSSTGSIANVKIELSTDGGNVWTTITSSTINDGAYDWIVPDSPSTNCLIRISDTADATVSDASNDVFSIKRGVLTLSFPNGGETFFTNDLETISWSSAGSIANVKIELSTDGGNVWTTITSSTTNDGAYDWVVPDSPSTNCLIRISDTADATVSDASNDVFSIKRGVLTLTAPNGHELFLINTSVQIQWTSGGNISAVDLEYSSNGGSSWNTIVSSTANIGTYDWTLPGVESDSYLVRISDSADNGISDVSDAVFTVTSGALTLTAPNGGERLLNGSGFLVTWDTLGDVPVVDLEYSTDNGLSWLPMATGLSNTGSYAWSVPFDLTNTALVRVSDASDGNPSDTSDDVFSIVSQLDDMEITIDCDDEYTLYVNGQLVGSDAQWDVAQTYIVPLVDGLNVLAVQAVNPHKEGGLIAEVKLNGDVVLVTDASWRYTLNEEPGWFDPDFDDSNWQNATDQGAYGVAPWFTNIQGIPTNTSAHWIWEPDLFGQGGFYRAGFVVSNTTPVPQILSFEPQQGPPGTLVTLTGINFDGASRVTFNGENADNFTVVSSTEITVTVPQAATTGNIAVTTPGGVAESATDFVVTPARHITTLVPNGGERVRVDSLFQVLWSSEGPVSFVRIDYSLDAGRTWNQVVEGTDNTGSFNWTVPDTASDSCLVRISDVADSTVFDISDSLFAIEKVQNVLLPLITGFSPDSAVWGAEVTISGENFVDVATVSFGDSLAEFTVLSSDEIKATAPSGAVSGPISVTTATGTATSASVFTVLFLPEISSFSPQEGVPGTEVTIQGQHFADVSKVWFGDKMADFEIESPTTLVAFVPDSAETSVIRVQNSAGTASSSDVFTVLNETARTSVTFLPTDDAQIDLGKPSTNCGRKAILEAQDSSYVSYLKFRVFGINGTVEKAYLSLYVEDGGPSGGSLYRANNFFHGLTTEWDEFRLLADNAPAFEAILSSVDTVASGTRVQFDVSAAVDSNGTYSFALVSDSGDSVVYGSKEAGEHSPRLVVEFEGQPAEVPQIVNCEPKSVASGSEVSLFGKYFSTATAVFFNGTRSSAFTVVSDEELVAVVPKGSRSGPVGVENDVATGVSNVFLTIVPGLSLESFEPDSAAVDSEVVLRGRGFLEVNTVYFGDYPAEFFIDSDSEIHAVVPDSAASGFIVLESPFEESVSPRQFFVRSPGQHGVTHVSSGADGMAPPEEFQLVGSYPNPFNLQVTIQYALPARERVQLAIYNLLGQRVRVLVDELQAAGYKSAQWDGRDDAGDIVASGIYFVRLVAGEKSVFGKISLQK